MFIMRGKIDIAQDFLQLGIGTVDDTTGSIPKLASLTISRRHSELFGNFVGIATLGEETEVAL